MDTGRSRKDIIHVADAEAKGDEHYEPRMPLKMAVDIMAFGRVFPASLSSSDMCVAASEPSRETVGLMIPTRQASPVLPQPPASVNCVKTSEAVERGVKTQSGIMMAKPRTWRMRTRPSTNGNCLARSVLKIPHIMTTAILSKVPCHR
jgi:hypothetical protein